jgi:hypothetical protein
MVNDSPEEFDVMYATKGSRNTWHSRLTAKRKLRRDMRHASFEFEILARDVEIDSVQYRVRVFGDADPDHFTNAEGARLSQAN